MSRFEIKTQRDACGSKTYSDKRPVRAGALKLPPPAPDQRTMQFLVSSRRTRVLMDISGFAFALSLIAIVSQSS